LGLSGQPAEIDRAFKAVDVDSSGKIDRDEFSQAVKDSRLAELSLTVLVEGMDGHLEGLEDIFVTYKSKLEEARKQAAADLENNRGKFMQYQTTARRRRAMKKKYMDDIAKFARGLVEKVCPEVDKLADQE
jgi:hypothetical protein